LVFETLRLLVEGHLSHPRVGRRCYIDGTGARVRKPLSSA
jgi:hypothetical protein